MSDMTILSTYKMTAVELHMRTLPFKDGELAMPDPDLLFGLELEIEKFPRQGEMTYPGLHFAADNSLRDGGLEAITQPHKASTIEPYLRQFFKAWRITADNYSERCSTHVHMNVQDFTWGQLKVLCLLYQMFERLLFNFIGHDRKDNVFCVPWYESGLTSRFLDHMQKKPDDGVRRWFKYSAVNLLPVRIQGSLEFRHLHGTCDVDKIMNWLKLLSRMAVYAKKTTQKSLTTNILEMNTVSNYDQFMMDVFGEDRHLLTIGDYQGALGVGVIDTKLMLLKRNEKQIMGGTLTPEDMEAMLRNIPARRPAVARDEAPEVAVEVEAPNPAARHVVYQPWPHDPPRLRRQPPAALHRFDQMLEQVRQIEAARVPQPEEGQF